MAEELKFYRGRRVFVTGHTGFKGVWLCRTLALAGASVCGYSLPPETEPSLFALLGGEHTRGGFGDVRDFSALEAAMRAFAPEVVFHLAAQPLVGRGYREPRFTYETNVMGTVNVLEAARACPSVRSVLVVTTDKVYREENLPCAEEMPLDGADPYSNSKSCAELVCGCYRRTYFAASGVAVSSARAGNAVGGGDFTEGRLVPDFFRAAQANVPLLSRSPSSVRPYQFVLEPLSAYLRIAAAQAENAELAGAYNAGPLRASRNEEVLRLLCKEWGSGSYEAAGAPSLRETGILQLDSAKIASVLGWNPRTDLHDAVRLTCEWERARLNGEDMAAFTDGQIRRFFGIPEG